MISKIYEHALSSSHWMHDFTSFWSPILFQALTLDAWFPSFWACSLFQVLTLNAWFLSFWVCSFKSDIEFTKLKLWACSFILSLYPSFHTTFQHTLGMISHPCKVKCIRVYSNVNSEYVLQIIKSPLCDYGTDYVQVIYKHFYNYIPSLVPIKANRG